MNKLTMVAASSILLAASSVANASGVLSYEVTITNITKGQTFTPILASTHKADIAYFEAGGEASPELGLLAEDGATGPLEDLLLSHPDLVSSTASNGALLHPGESVTIEIDAERGFNRLSFAAMLIPTNDTFVALNSVSLPRKGHYSTHVVPAYDAGTEPNDENCAHIPGPVCGGVGASPEAGGEGFVHIANGMHGIGDLAPETYDWRNPVARVSIEALR